MKVYYISDEMTMRFCREVGKEKYNSLLTQNSQKFIEQFQITNIVFLYHFTDAWHHKIAAIQIDGSNVSCWRNSDTAAYFLPSASVQNIYEIVRKYSAYFKSDDYYIENSGLYDGYMYRIIMSDGECLYISNLENIAYHNNLPDHPNTQIFLNFLNEIFALLKNNGIDTKYLILKKDFSDHKENNT